MFKKLSLILAAATLCANMGIAAPVSAQTATEETVLVESNFQNCNLGTYTAANQLDGETDLRNGVVMTDNDAAITTGYTIKNGDSYESISEADIVDDNGTRVLRLGAFLSESYDMGNTAEYPVVQSAGTLPNSGKVKIDLDIKVSYPARFWMYHSTSTNGGAYGIWRFERFNNSDSKIMVLDNTYTNRNFRYDKYNKVSAIMDTATGDMDFYLEDEYIYTATGTRPWKDWQLYLRQAPHQDIKPTLTYNEEDSTKIESVTNPQYVYIKSLKVTTYTDTALESVTPANDSTVVEQKEAVFTFNNEIKSFEKAEVYEDGSVEPVDVTESIIVEGKTIKVPYTFEIKKNYKVTLTGVSDGLTSTDATTSFITDWNFSNLTGSPANTSPVDNNTYLINEDFTNSNHGSKENIINEANKVKGLSVELFQDAKIVELDDGNKVYQVETTGEAIFHMQFGSLGYLDDTAILSFDMYRKEGTVNFIVDRYKNALAASWYLGYSNIGQKPMTEGEWHKVVITFTEAGTTVYVDGKFVQNTPKGDTYLGHKDTKIIRLITNRGSVQIDNLKLYLDKSETALTAVAPAYDATEVKASTPLEFTYNELIGDVSGAKLIVKPADTNEETVLTNGNGMSVTVENSTVKVVLDNALNANLGYAVELSGLKDVFGAEIGEVRTKFSTVADDEWIMTDVAAASAARNIKNYSFKLKHQGDAENAQLIVATYNTDGSLSKVARSDVKSVGADWTDFSANAEYSASKSTKLFIWNSVNGMTPIFNAISK